MKSFSFPDFLNSFLKRRLALLRDDLSPASRAVLLAPAENISEAALNEMLSVGGNIPFVALSSERVSVFGLTRMGASRPFAAHNGKETLDVYVSVEAREGVSTGISIHDRTCTIQALGHAAPSSRLLISPGHVFPVEVRGGGVLVKSSLAEGAFDIVRIAGFRDAACFVDLLNAGGSFLDEEQQRALSYEHSIPLLTLGDLIRYRLETESLVSRIAETKLPTSVAGEFRAYIYRSSIHTGEHLALVKGRIEPTEPILTRVQPEFTFGDVFGGSTPPTRKTLHNAMRAIEKAQRGVLVYLRRPDEGQLRQQVGEWRERFAQQPAALMREYGLGAQILADIGVRKINLLTNSKRKLVGLKSFGIEIVSTTPLAD